MWTRKFACPALPVFLLCLLLTPAAGTAQEMVDSSAEPEALREAVFTDNLGRDTPRSSFEGFLAAAEQFDFEAARQFIDLRNLPYDVSRLGGEELARQLDFIIKRGMHIDVNHLSERPAGEIVDGLPDYRDELGRVVTDEGEEVLLMQRVPGQGDDFIWKVSNETIARIPALYDYFSYPGWIEKVREKVPGDAGFLGVELFKWVIVLGIVLVSAPFVWLLGLALSRVISKPGAPLHVPVRKLFTRPLPLFAVGIIVGLVLEELGLSVTAHRVIESKTLITIVTVWIIFSLIDLARAKRRQKFLARGRTDAHVLGRPLANALKLLTLIVATLVWLSNSGVNITTLLAGLGVGGVALALALQKPIEDLLGAISIYSQQPIQTGDLCKYGSVFGTIEEIGLRTTRIRTLDNTLVSVPNSIIAHGAIENFSARETLLYHPELPLRYDTTHEQLQDIIEGIGSMARTHEKVVADSVRVRFIEFAENAMIVRARIYIDETDFSNYLAVVEDLNLSIMKIVQNAGAHFAQGARTVMLEQAADSQ
jgi:MscS family membrane protein